MSSQLDFAALEDCLKTLNHLYIDINRLKAEAGYETKRGGYGEVQVSRLDSGTAGSKLVAAKKIYLKARHKEHERLAFRLARELKVWASLHHQHVLPVVGYYLDKDCRIAVLMSEYMVHGDLKDYIEQEKPSWDVRLYLIRDTTAGLAYLHGQDPPIRHGDLKTGNVLINAERRAVLADFGLSRTLEEGPTGLTTSDGLKGTLRYYSPEIVAETADCHSLPSDIWAWACLVLEVLADIIPYAGKKSEHSIIKALMNNEPPSDTTSLPIPVPAVKHLLARCWTIQPNERPSVDHCLAIIATELSALQMTPGVGRDSNQGSYLQSSNFDENYSFNRPHEDGGWPPAMGSQAGPTPTATQNRLGMIQGPQESLAAQHGLSWAPANFTPLMTQQIRHERLQTMVNAPAFQQQQQASAPPRVPSTQPLQTSPQQQSQPGPSNWQMQFHEFFTIAFNQWLSQQQLTLDPPRVEGKEVELHKLFLMVGALGGCRAVSEKKLWPFVGAKYFDGTIPYSKPEVAEQLSKIYQKILADFEVHWHNSLRPRDPNSIFPLPAQLQYLHPEIERLATAQFPLPQPQQTQQRPLGTGPQQPPDGNAGRGTPSQMTQQTPQMNPAQAVNHQQEALMQNQQPGMAFPSQPGNSGQGGPMAGLNNLPPLPPQLQQLFNNPEVMKLSPEELKRRGLNDDIVQTVMVYRQAWIAKQMQTRREQEQLLQQRQMQAQQAHQAAAAQAANLLNVKKETPQMAPGNRPPSGLGGAQQPPGLGPAVGNSLQPSALPQQPGGPQLPATVAGLNVSPEQLAKAQKKVRAAIDLFHNKCDYSSINLSHEQGILMEQSVQQTQSLLKQVAQNLIAFVVLAPNDERVLNEVAQTVVTLSDQARILQKQPPEKRFIFGLGDLNQYRNHLTSFLMRVKGLQSQAMALQNQQASDALPPGPPPPKPPSINSQFALGKKPVPKRKLPPKRGATKPTSKIPPAEVRGISRPEPERPQSSKREREDDVTGLDGSAGPYGPPKRVRTDPQEDLYVKRTVYMAGEEQEGLLDSMDRTTKEYEKVSTSAQPEGEGDDWLWAIDSTQWVTEDPALGETQG